MKRTAITTAYSRHRSGFTLVEVLVAIIVLLVGVVVALRIFPRGFDVLNRTERSMLALEQLERMQMNFIQSPDMLAEAILPVDDANLIPQELLSWSDLSAVQLAGYDDLWYKSYLFPVSSNQKLWPLWQPLSARIFRRVVGERCVIAGGFSTGTRDVYAPKYLVQFGPIENVFDAADPTKYASTISVYDLRYRKVSYGDLQAMLTPSASSRLSDTLYYAVDYQKGEMYFLPDPSATTREVRLAYAAIGSVGKLTSSIQSHIPIPLANSGMTTVALGSAVLPGSEVVNRQYVINAAAESNPSILRSGEFYAAAATDKSWLNGNIFFSREDVGNTVKIDYTVADWGILHDDVTVDDAGYIQLTFSPKTRNVPILPRESRSWGLYGPMKNGSIVIEIIHSDSGNVYSFKLDSGTADFRCINFEYIENSNDPDYPSDPNDPENPKNIKYYALEPDKGDRKRWHIYGCDRNNQLTDKFKGDRLRVYYRAVNDWTMQYFRIPAKMYADPYIALSLADLQNKAFGMEWFGLFEGWVALPSLYTGHTVAIDYQYQLTAGDKDYDDADERQLKRVEGEVHVVPASDKPSSLLMLKHSPATGTEVRVRGVSVSLRAMWAQQSSGKALIIGDGPTTTKTISDRWLAKQTMMIVPPGAQ